ncbi:hypothetical protein A2U01_0110741, partial [Trifolium medium]|nr:hypothetical protein [Trifolium medium]
VMSHKCEALINTLAHRIGHLERVLTGLIAGGQTDLG